MTTTADALEIMTVVAACHHRTAPRTDDHQAALATATIWAELIDPYQLDQADLIAAVKHRARLHFDAPEPSDIIRIARQIRGERLNDTDPGEPPREDLYGRHSANQAAKDPAEYPAHWTPDQRLTAYWYAHRQNATPTSTNSWEALLKQAQNTQTRRP